MNVYYATMLHKVRERQTFGLVTGFTRFSRITRFMLFLCCIFFVTMLLSRPALGTTWSTYTIDSTRHVGMLSSLAMDTYGNYIMSYYDQGNQDLKFARYENGLWTRSVIDSEGSVGLYSSLAVDLEGKSVISYYDYTNGDLKFAKYENRHWSISTVDSVGDVGLYTSISVDLEGNYVISYYDTTNDDLKFAKYDGDSWTSSTIDSGGFVGTDTSIAVDQAGNYIISYHSANFGDLKCAKYSGGSWTLSTIDSVGTVGQYSSLVVDNDDNYHVAYWDFSNKDLKYAKYEDSAWSTSTVDSAGDLGQSTSITVDHDDNPVISYYDSTNGDLKVASYDGSEWAIETVDSISSVGLYSSIEVDFGGNYIVSYLDDTYHHLKLAISGPHTTAPEISLEPLSLFSVSDQTPHIEGVATENGVMVSEVQYQIDSTLGEWIGCASDDGLYDEQQESFSCDVLSILPYGSHTVYVRGTNSVGLTTETGQETSDTFFVNQFLPEMMKSFEYPEEVGINTSLAVDDDGNYIIIYFDQTNEDLKYTLFEDGEWSNGTIDATGSVGNYSDIAIDKQGNYIVSFSDESSYDLKFAKYENGVWTTSVVDTEGYVGRYNSIAVDDDNNYLISYFEDNTSQLKFAKYENGSWVTMYVDPSVFSCMNGSSIAVDPDGSYVISYNRFFNEGLNVAKYENGEWNITPVLTYPSPTLGYAGTSLLIDDVGNYFIAFSDAFSGQLQVARYENDEWSFDKVDVEGYGSVNPSLAMDNSGNLILSYAEEVICDLKLAKYDNRKWSKMTLDSIPEVGRRSSLAVDHAGNYLISYMYADELSLQFLKITNDLLPPAISLTPISPDPASNKTPTIQGTVSDEVGAVTNVEFQMDGTSGPWTTCLADDGVYGEEQEESFSCFVENPLGDGEHTIYIRSSDGINTTPLGSESIDVFVVDTTPSSLLITYIDHYVVTPRRWIVNRRPLIEGTSEPNTSINIEVTQAGISSWIVSDESGQWSWQSSLDLPYGTQDVSFTAWDAAFNSASTTISLVVTARFPAKTDVEFVIEPDENSNQQEDSVSEEGQEAENYDGKDTSDSSDDRISNPSPEGFQNFLEDVVINTGAYVNDKIKDANETPAVKAAAMSLLVVSSVTGGADVAAVSATSFIQFPLLLANSLFGAIGGWGRKRKPWGVVYDSVTKEPISRAVVRIFRGDTLASTAVTDVYGAFIADLEEGSYSLHVQKGSYTFPSSLISGNTDGIRSPIYKGGVVHSSKFGSSLNVYIPLDPIGTLRSGRVATRARSLGSNILSAGSIILLLLASIFSFWSYLAVGGILYLLLGVLNSAILVINIGLRSFVTKEWGIVLTADGKPLPGIEIGLYDRSYGKLIDSRVTDDNGHFRFIVPGGKYLIKPVGSRFQLYGSYPRGGVEVGKDTDQNIVIAKRLVVQEIV